MDNISKQLLSAVRNILLLVLSVGFLGIGMLHTVGYEGIREQFLYWNYPIWSMYVVGILEIIAAVMVFYKPARIKGIIVLLVIMVGALVTHIFNGQSDRITPPLFLGILLLLLLLSDKYLDQRN